MTSNVRSFSLLLALAALVALPAGAEDTISRPPMNFSIEPLEAERAMQPAKEAAPKRAAAKRSAKAKRRGLAAATPAETPSVVTPAPVGPVISNGAGMANLRVEAILPASSPEGFPNSGFCGNNPGGGAADTARAFVRNVGSAPSAASVAAIHWGHGGMTLRNVPALIVGQAVIVEATIPQACFGPRAHGSCDFLFEADRNDQVDETEENADNYDNGSCMLPGT